ncbi:putative L-asparaginase [Armadillidium nasatum]|uniref:Putative L-asparaginase n=1 Tax=Armadillidium nasatum TaxID=96803 RepID=A0A5N5T9D6_9CRUS|nr:putative L-asparaginase [Armadillidium nasatum]
MLASVILNNRGSAIDAVTAATRILEDSPITNAGVGSSLTVDGSECYSIFNIIRNTKSNFLVQYKIRTVECDATVMDGKSLVHGSVGAVSGVENPILLAKKLLEAQSESLPGGLISPRTLESETTYNLERRNPFSSIYLKSIRLFYIVLIASLCSISKWEALSGYHYWEEGRHSPE